MIEEIGLLLILLHGINFMLHVAKWYVESRKPPPLTYLQLLVAHEFIKKDDITKDDLERVLDEKGEEVKLFIFEEIRKESKKRFDEKLKIKRNDKAK